MMSYANALDITEIVKDPKYIARFKNLQFSSKGQVCRCPFHAGDNTPSFHIYFDSNQFHCFGCNRHGDGITLLMELEGIPYKEAKALFDSYLTPEKKLEVAIKSQLEKTGESINDINTRFSTFCRKFYQRKPKLVYLLDQKIYEFDQFIQQEGIEVHRVLQKFNEITNFLLEYRE